MRYLLTGGDVWTGSSFEKLDVAIQDGRIVSVSPFIDRAGYKVVEFHHRLLVPGFVDVHVHLREPGFSYKETIRTGTQAAAAGGYTQVLSMPNLNPVPDSLEALQEQLALIGRDAVVRVLPYGAITKGEQGEELADLEAMAPYVAGFTDDGRGVQSDDMMRQAMLEAKRLGKPIVAHCEVNELLRGGCIHDGRWAREHGFPGICSESEWRQIERDLKLVEETGCQYHVCHISAKESVELIRRAKSRGLPVTCETGPHYLTLCDEDLQDEGRFKMNPPLRSAADRDALIAGLLDGTIDCIITDHAPHSAEEKSKGLRGSAMGVVGLETAFAVLYTKLVEPGIVPLETILDRLIVRPRKIFGLPERRIAEGQAADLTILNLHAPHVVDPDTFLTQGRATPFAGMTVTAAVEKTFCDGKVVYDRAERSAEATMTLTARRQLTKDVFELTFSGDTSAITRPGQFVNILVEGCFLRRPISVCDWAPGKLTLIARAQGQGTQTLCHAEIGTRFSMLMGLGNGYDVDAALEHKPILVGGGVGVPPLYALAKAFLVKGVTPTIALGFNSDKELFYAEEFQALGCPVLVSTADGSYGTKGFVPAVIEKTTCDYALCCGPIPMLRAVDAMPQITGGQYSFEERMGCGFGACVGCTCKTKYGNKRICKDGPVLFKEEIIW